MQKMPDNTEAICKNIIADWRAEKDNYNEQMEHFYLNEEFADINFVFNRHGTITVFIKYTQFQIATTVKFLENSCSQICDCCGI